MEKTLLCMNCGSTNVKFSVFPWTESVTTGAVIHEEVSETDLVFRILERRRILTSVVAVGHRVVHGGLDYRDPVLISASVIQHLKGQASIDPDHMPREIQAIERCRERLPGIPQVACFDTGFHRDLPDVARLYPLPAFYAGSGIIRYGFHGLSCESVLQALKLAGADLGQKMIIAHLGGGSSLTAVKGGRSVDTTMGFSPCGGLPMGTRSGDLDPGAVLALMEREGLSREEVRELLNRHSGLLGLSGIASDMKELLSLAPENSKASQAIDYYCYHARKHLAAMAAALGGIDLLVFTGGIGERSPEIRRAICESLGFLGIEIDPSLNDRGAPVISAKDSKAVIRIIPADEERIIASHTRRILGGEKTWNKLDKAG